MLRCSRCGCRRFVFTIRGDKYGEHHGAVCAACHKRLKTCDLSVFAMGTTANDCNKETVLIRNACGTTKSQHPR